MTHDTVISKARVLMEALPYIQRYSGRIVVVKYGGNAMTDAQMQRNFARDIVLLHFVGIRPVVVHGGGPQISELMRRLDHTPRFVDGLRVTGPAELDVVRMVLQKTNKQIVSLLHAEGGRCAGISGEDGALLSARRLSDELGLVGEIDSVDVDVVDALLSRGFIPVIAPIGLDRHGQAYNINADTAAGAIAVALKASKLVYLTDVEGLYEDFGDSGSLLSKVTASELETMLASGKLHSGMIPKVQSCVRAVRSGVERAHILDGRLEHAVLLEIFTDSGVGTMVTEA